MFCEVRVPILLVVAIFASLSVQGRRHKRQDAMDNVDFLIGMDSTARLYTSGGNSSYDTLMNIPGFVETVDYHLSKHLIFGFANDTLYKTNLDTQRRKVASTQNAQLVKVVSRCPGFTVDWVYDRIYWAHCDATGTSIMSFGLDGEKVQTVLSRAFDSYVYSMEIDPYRGIVFWAVYETIQSVETSGKGFNPKVTKTDDTNRMMALDLRMRRLYYVDTTSLFSTDYTGGEKVEHFSVPQLWRVNGLSILGDKVYWEKEDNRRAVIYEAPLNPKETEGARILRTIDKAVFYLRVMHPTLQGRHRIDSFPQSCVASGATSETFVCPPGQTLNHDGVSCHKPECMSNEDCATDKVCTEQKCVDPCPGVCGPHTVCHVTNHVATCSCSPGYSGDPITGYLAYSSGTWPPVPHGKKRYYVKNTEKDEMSWLNATMACLRNNSRLVSVESMEELWDIRREINNTEGWCIYYWTSGTDVGRDYQDYVWASTGTRLPAKSDMWSLGEPVENDNKHCVQLGKQFTNKPIVRPEHELFGYQCDDLTCYICEYYS